MASSTRYLHSELHEALFRELHHRFYNSLQVISSMARGLSRADSLPDAIACIEDRIALLSSLHRMLAEPIVPEQDITPFVETLCEQLVGGFGRYDAVIEVAVKQLPGEPNVARGLLLIIVELVSNALKHARYASPITVKVRAWAEHEDYILIVSDTGASSQPAKSPRLATHLAQALGGNITISTARGYGVCIILPGVCAPDPGRG